MVPLHGRHTPSTPESPVECEVTQELKEAMNLALSGAQNIVDEIGERERLEFTLAHFGLRNIPSLREKMYLVFRSNTDITDPEQRYRNHFAVVTGFVEAPNSLNVSTMDLGEEGDIKGSADTGYSLLTETGESMLLPPESGGLITVDHTPLVNVIGYLNY